MGRLATNRQYSTTFTKAKGGTVDVTMTHKGGYWVLKGSTGGQFIGKAKSVEDLRERYGNRLGAFVDQGYSAS